MSIIHKYTNFNTYSSSQDNKTSSTSATEKSTSDPLNQRNSLKNLSSLLDLNSSSDSSGFLGYNARGQYSNPALANLDPTQLESPLLQENPSSSRNDIGSFFEVMEEGKINSLNSLLQENSGQIGSSPSLSRATSPKTKSTLESK